MFDSLKSKVQWLGTGWYWPLVLLVLAGCGLMTNGECCPDYAFDSGPLPHTSAIMCEIPVPQAPGPAATSDIAHCAESWEKSFGIRLEDRAVALVMSQTSTVGLDYSKTDSTCSGEPQAIAYFGKYPEGYQLCLNCGTQVPAVYPDAKAVCIAQCKDLLTFGSDTTPVADADAFCEAHARAATNFPPPGQTCFDNACKPGGTAIPDFADPRRVPEPVKWTGQIGTKVVGTTLSGSVTGPTDDTGFIAGAASEQFITSGNGWVEFQAGESGLSHVVGLSDKSACAPACFDNDPSLNDIQFGFRLENGEIYIIQSGTNVTGVFGQGPNGSFGPYTNGERFRITVTDHLDGHYTIKYFRAGNLLPLYENSSGIAKYPLGVDARFREKNASLVDVNLVRIQNIQ